MWYSTNPNELLPLPYKTHSYSCLYGVCFSFSISNIITIESTKKLQAMISAVSTMLLKGLHGATSIASYRKQDINSEGQNTTDSGIRAINSNTAPILLYVKFSFCSLTLSVQQQEHFDYVVLTVLKLTKQLQASNILLFFYTLFWIPYVNYSRNQCATKQIPQIYRGCNCYICLLYIYSLTLM